MIIVVTGMVGIDKKTYLADVCDYAAQRGKDILLCKWDMAGNQIWNTSWDDSLESYSPKGIWGDSLYVYVCGSINDSSQTYEKLILLKYDADGTRIWNKTWPHKSEGSGISGYEISPGNSVIYTSGSNNTDSALGQCFLVKWDADGNPLWNSTWETFGGHGESWDCWVNQTDVVTVGRCYTDNYNGILIRWNANDGTRIWNRSFGCSECYEGLTDLAVVDGDIYCTGYISLTSDLVLAKYNWAGDWQWNTTYSTPVDEKGYSIVADDSGIYVAGYQRDAVSSFNGLVVRFSLDGEFLWPLRWAGDAKDIATGIYKNTTSLYVVGYTASLNTKYDQFIQKYSNVESLALPGAFSLTGSADQIDSDGKFRLSWTESVRATNYSVYRTSSCVTLLDPAWSPISSNLQTLYLDVSESQNGNYYYIVKGQNEFGEELTSCHLVRVQIPPGPFNLTTDAGDPDQNGAFFLEWNASVHATNYTVYWSKDPISKTNDPGVTKLYEGLEQKYYITEWNQGTFYFLVVASNEFGTQFSDLLTINVKFPVSSFGKGSTWWIQAIFYGAISAATGLLIRQGYGALKKNKIAIKSLQSRLSQVDNIEAFLKEKLEYEDWLKLQEPLKQYNNRDITRKELVKQGRKLVGKKFTGLLGQES